jgi:hypothetical protein
LWAISHRWPCPEDDALWISLKAIEDHYHADVRSAREQRERVGQKAVAEKQALINQARSISADDRSSGDQWRRIMDQWKAAGRGPKADEDQLWTELNQLREAHKRQIEAQYESPLSYVKPRARGPRCGRVRCRRAWPGRRRRTVVV